MKLLLKKKTITFVIVFVAFKLLIWQIYRPLVILLANAY